MISYKTPIVKTTSQWSLYIMFIIFSCLHSVKSDAAQLNARNKQRQTVTVAILAVEENIEHMLPLYLDCLEKQTWPADRTYIYIRANKNDPSSRILHKWANRVRKNYLGIYFNEDPIPAQVYQKETDESDLERLHEWANIRKASVVWAREHNSHYFVLNCRNFIIPETITALVRTDLPIVAPLLTTGDNDYSNYHAAVDKNGYFKDSPLYLQLLNQEVKSLVEVPVVHSTYLVRRNFLNKVSYDDMSNRYNYVIFSGTARKNGIRQYLDTREMYGRIASNNKERFAQESWLEEFQT